MSDHQRVGQHDSVGAPPPPGPVELPRTIKWAVIGMWIGAAMTVLGVYIWYVEIVAINEKTYGDDYADMDGFAQAGVMFSVGVAAVLALIKVALWIAMALTNRSGFSWARIVATVLGTLGLLYAIFNFATSIVQQNIVPVALAYSVLNQALAIAILVLLWLPISTRYYQFKKIQRARRVVSLDK
ncbi:MAG: hypothetical protein M3306_29275 [Actinomycetota bacterium]|nr:hypothetical protein [Actinomycetota bacterium]